MRVRAAALAILVGLVGLPEVAPFAPARADAAVSIAYSLERLVGDSARVSVVRALERRSEWAVVGGSRRIVTYTRLRTLESVIGDGNGDVWVRTLGGVVERIGQQVSGEAAFELDQKSLVFLTRTVDGVWAVTGMGQGHFPVRAVKDGERTIERLASSRDVGALVMRKAQRDVAHARLVGQALGEAIALVRGAKREADAAPR
ncbi:MAG: hypothetical protein FJ095_18755 [Deltaproteobacteria bacterium]|nr:hypothetical protein [Deltaproteobacteria bacterium]